MLNYSTKLFANTVWLFAILCATAHSQTPDAVEGFSHPHRSAKVAASTAGLVKQWLVAEGDAVIAGQPLVKLDDEVHQTLVAIAEAAIESRGEFAQATAEHKLRKQRLEAIEELADKGHATSDELNRATSEWEVAAARVLASQENQRRSELELKKLKAQSRSFTVVAPFGGVVTKIHRVAGEYVGPVEPVVCELAELDNLSARFLAPNEVVENLTTGDEISVQFIASGATATGVVTISPYPDAETGMRSIQVRIENQTGAFVAGVRCKLVLQSQRSRGLSSTPPSSAKILGQPHDRTD